MSPLFDAHCHLDFEVFVDPDDELGRAAGVGVRELHIPGVAPSRWRGAAALAERCSGVGFGVGIHPWWLAEVDQLDAALGELATVATSLGAEAIGECGLDAPLAKRGGPSLDAQERVLEAHIAVARHTDLPLVLHVVGAHGRALEVLRRHPPLAGMVHSYSGSAELVADYVARGLHLSFATAITRDSARKPLAAARATPLARLLVESDGPDQPLAGERISRPADVAAVVAAVARARAEPEATIASHTHANACALFGRDPRGR